MNTRGMRSVALGCALALAGCATQPVQQHISGAARAQDPQSLADMVSTFALNPRHRRYRTRWRRRSKR